MDDPRFWMREWFLKNCGCTYQWNREDYTYKWLIRCETHRTEHAPSS